MRRLAVTAALTLAACAPAARHTVAVEGVYAPDGLPHLTPSTADVAERTVTAARASRSAPLSPAPTLRPRPELRSGPEGAGGVRTVSSTGYCQGGRTASGEQTHVGGVAANWAPLGSRWRVVQTGAIYVVNDRVGWGSDFDIFMPSCAAAITYGRRTIQVEAA